MIKQEMTFGSMNVQQPDGRMESIMYRIVTAKEHADSFQFSIGTGMFPGRPVWWAATDVLQSIGVLGNNLFSIEKERLESAIGMVCVSTAMYICLSERPDAGVIFERASKEWSAGSEEPSDEEIHTTFHCISWNLNEAIDLARQQGPVMHIPTGALIGLDAMLAAAEGTIHSVRMVTRKPPEGLIGAPHLIDHDIRVEGLTEPLKVFEGNALAAAKGFPANLNVVVALALAGIGPQRTMLEVWADPTIKRNVHSIEVDSDSARFTMTMENIPSENPKTSKIVGQSVIALLRKMRSGFRLGT